jgi:hypothetical protein
MLALLVLSIGACSLPPRAPDPCAVTGGAPRADVVRAQTACAQARQRFKMVVGEPPGGSITLSSQSALSTYVEESRWSLTWPTSALLERSAPRGNADAGTRRFLEEQWNDVLPHEIGHIMLGAWLFSPGRVPIGEYGTYLPDWVDEAVAISMEPDTTRRERLAQARAFIRPPSLEEVLSAHHPYQRARDEAFSTHVLSSPPCEGPCPGRARPNDTRIITSRIFRDGRVTIDTTYVAGARTLEVDPLARFYILSYALWAYVESRGGRDATAALLDRLRRNPRDQAALAGLRGLPATLGAVEADWRVWLKATPPARATGAQLGQTERNLRP